LFGQRPGMVAAARITVAHAAKADPRHFETGSAEPHILHHHPPSDPYRALSGHTSRSSVKTPHVISRDAAAGRSSIRSGVMQFPLAQRAAVFSGSLAPPTRTRLYFLGHDASWDSVRSRALPIQRLGSRGYDWEENPHPVNHVVLMAETAPPA